MSGTPSLLAPHGVLGPQPGPGQDQARGRNHLKLTFVADRPPPPHLVYQEVWMAAEASPEYSP